MRYFTSDLHFGRDANRILRREFRPFKSPMDYMKYQIDLFNSVMTKDDDLYCIGDFINYNEDEKDYLIGMEAINKINAKVHIVIGNNEIHMAEGACGVSLLTMQNRFLQYGAIECELCIETEINGIPTFLVHRIDEAREDMLNLFGHTHNITGRFSPLGINVGIDTSHFQPYSADDIYELLGQHKKFWVKDPNIWMSLWGSIHLINRN